MKLKMKFIYRFLKQHGDATASHLAAELKMSIEEVTDLLDKDVAAGYIVKEGDNYRVKIILGPLTKKDNIIPLWKHDVILQGVAAAEPLVKIPRAQFKAMLEAIIWWQGGRGTCVGFAGALYRWLLYMLGTGIIPTVEELKAYCKIIEEDIGCTAGKFQYMTMHPDIDSPQWIYDRSRKYGNCTYPAGSDTTWAAKIIALEGSVKWNDCLTSITGYCAPELWIGHNAPYEEALAKLAPLAADHKNKFAASNNFNEVFEAIKVGKAVFGPVNLPPDFLNPPNGQWQVYAGGSAGGHAVFGALVDETERLIITRGSWDKDGGYIWYSFDERFFDENAGPFLIGLTQEEAKYGELIYKSLNITTNVPAQVSVDGVVLGMSPQKIVREKGKEYVISVSADGYTTRSETVDESTVDPFNIVLESVPQPAWSWWKFLVNIFAKIKELLRKWI